MIKRAKNRNAILLGLSMLAAAVLPQSAVRVHAATGQEYIADATVQEDSAGQNQGAVRSQTESPSRDAVRSQAESQNQNAVQSQTAGSIELQLPQEAAGAQISLYQVALLSNDGYTTCGSFEGCGFEIADLNDNIAAQEATKQLAAYAKTNETEGQEKTAGEDGLIRFEDLAPALYLTAQTGGEEKAEIQPALIPVPHMVDGMEVYSAVVSPKYSIPGGAVIVNKTDENGNALGQAYFVLQSKVYSDSGIPEGVQTGSDERGSFYWKEFKADLVTNDRGQLTVSDLPMGDYRFIEVKSPAGYVLSSKLQEFTVSEAGTVKEVSGVYLPDSGAVQELTVVNNRTMLLINKVDEEGKPVNGAKLAIRNADGSAIRNAAGKEMYSFTTTGQPYEIKGLPAGEYTVRELEAPDGYKTAQDVRVTLSDAEGAVNEVTMVDERQEEGKTSLTVTKSVVDLNEKYLYVQNSIFYVALFEDKERTQRVTDVKALHFQDSFRESVTFDDLETGKTYYVGETDEAGTYLTSGYVEGCVFEADFPRGYEVTPGQKQSQNTLEFRNIFHDIPHNYYYNGEITVTKKVMKGDELFDSKEIYYAAVFEDRELTQIHGDVITLDMDGASELSVTVPVQIRADGDPEVTYYIAETDRDGHVLSSSETAFEISIDHPSVTLSAEQNTEDVTITNTYPDRTDTPGAPNTPGGTSSGGSGGNGGTPVRTGDTTPLMLYLILMILSGTAVIAVFLRRRRER